MDRIGYSILVATEAEEELGQLRPYDRERVLDAMRSQPSAAPAGKTRNRKPIARIRGYEHVEPIWELRVGEYRVYYTPDEAGRFVRVWAVRRKGRKATGDVL